MKQNRRYPSCGMRGALLGTVLLTCIRAPASASLAERLERGETVTIAVLGDSLALGWELQNPVRDAYPAVFGAILQRRYPSARVRILGAGVAGDTAAGGAARVERDVLAHQPDAVVIQFGGNDHGNHRTPEAFQWDLEAILGKIAGFGVPAILATPPIAEPEPNTPMVKAVKAVAQAHAVPCADFDGALRHYGTGPRGSFPLGRHPGPHLHAVMGRALYRAFAELLDEGHSVTVSIIRGVRQTWEGEPVPITVGVRAQGAGPVAVFLECDADRLEQRVTANSAGQAVAVFRLPPVRVARTQRHRLLAWARRGRSFGCDLAWLTLAPVAEANGAIHELGQEGLVVSPKRWGGRNDLSGRFHVTREGERVRLVVQVQDDRVVRNAFFRAAYESDGAEVFLDLRPPQAQGRPYWDAGVVGWICHPIASWGSKSSWQRLGPFSPEWQPLAVRSRWLANGYQIEMDLPMALFRQYLAGGSGTVGFDVALDDADDDWGRKCQMVWAGGAEDFLDPSVFGGLWLRPTVGGKSPVRVVVR